MTESAIALLFTLAAIGIGVTSHLIKERLAQRVPVCFIGADCGKVLESQYNKLFGVHNDVLGIIYYLGTGLILAAAYLEFLPIPNALLLDLVLLGSIVGSVASAYFTYLQGAVIKAWCSWCLTSAVVTWLMLMVSVVARLI